MEKENAFEYTFVLKGVGLEVFFFRGPPEDKGL